jgi:DNA helicase-2/ATP-dependent DNA helicase PcrA
MAGSWRDQLNKAQREAVDHDAGPLAVLAGPGTGKTFVIIARLRRLIEEGSDPACILAVTFSVKAAAEMRARLAAAVGGRIAEQVQACTFHSFGHSLIRRFGDYIGLRRDGTIMDSAQQRRLLRRLIRDRELFGFFAARGRDEAIAGAMKFIAGCRHAARTPAEAVAHARAMASRIKDNPSALSGDELEAAREETLLFEHRARLFEAYDAACIERGLMTYDDFLTLPLRIFADKPVTAAIVRDEFRHVVADEFQDVNRAQVELLRHVAPPRLPSGKPPDLCVVGDDDQAIYGFRGADSAAFERFAGIWKDHAKVALRDNYRSGRSIIAAANAHIGRATHRFAPDKVIEAAARDGAEPAPGSVEGVILDDDKHAGLAIVAMIRRARELAEARGAIGDARYSSFGVIAFANATIWQIASVLEMHGIPVAIRQRTTPLDDAGVKDLMAWMRILASPTGATAGEPASIRRLLLRPPHFVPHDRVLQWQQAFERESTWRTEAERIAFMDWLAAKAHEEPALARFLALAAELRAFVMAHNAEESIRRIVLRAELALGEDLQTHERASRISNLAAVMRWAQSRQPHLDEPGDLRALLAYYDDLSKDDEKEFTSPGDSRLEATDDDPAPGAPDAPDAVWLMTAHKSKGLEFDTVFLAKCRPGGFPARRNDQDDDGVPDDFKGQATPDRDDEQRRLFYVACTRARRRLVLLAKAKKSQGDAADYYFELTQGSPGVTVQEFDGSTLIQGAGLSPDAAESVADEASAAHRRDEALSKEAAWIRQCAYAALHESADPALDDPRLADASHRLGEAAAALRAVERLRAGADPDRALAALADPFAARLRELMNRLGANAPLTKLLRPMKGPLELSYSAVRAYEKCPRCFYARYIEGLRSPPDRSMNVGRIVHAAIERYLKECIEAEKNERQPPGTARLLQLGEEEARRGGPDAASFDAEAFERATAQLYSFIDKFHDDSDMVLHIERKVRMVYPDPDDPAVSHRFEAKIDRIDQPADGGIRIVDYKTGDAL